MRLVLLITALLLAGLAGCASQRAPAPAPSPASTAAPAASGAVPVHPTLVAEQRRLSELFRGTPVVFAMQPDGSLRVEVPLSFCFDQGAFVVKPPLGAVLDRLAKSQRGETSRLRVAVASDSGASAQNLARDRAASTRDYLVARGVHATRVALASAAQGEGVEIVVVETPRR